MSSSTLQPTLAYEPASVYLLWILGFGGNYYPGVFLHNSNKNGRLAYGCDSNEHNFAVRILIKESNKECDIAKHIVYNSYRVASLRGGGRFPDERFTSDDNCWVSWPGEWVKKVLHILCKNENLVWNSRSPPPWVDTLAPGLECFLRSQVNQRSSALEETKRLDPTLSLMERLTHGLWGDPVLESRPGSSLDTDNLISSYMLFNYP